MRVGRRKDKDRACHLVLETVQDAGPLSPSLDKPEQFIEPRELVFRMIGHQRIAYSVSVNLVDPGSEDEITYCGS